MKYSDLFFLILGILIIGIIWAIKWGADLTNQKAPDYSINFNGEFSFEDKHIPVKKGVLIFSVPPQAVLRVSYPKIHKFIKIWKKEEVFLCVIYNGKTYALSGPQTALPVLADGEITIRFQYKKPFHPLKNKIWSGFLKGDEFYKSPIPLTIKKVGRADNLPMAKIISGSPVADTPAKKTLPVAGSPATGKKHFTPDIVLRGLGLKPEKPAYQKFLNKPVKVKINTANATGGKGVKND